jgi:hypothetical protein
LAINHHKKEAAEWREHAAARFAEGEEDAASQCRVFSGSHETDVVKLLAIDAEAAALEIG